MKKLSIKSRIGGSEGSIKTNKTHSKQVLMLWNDAQLLRDCKYIARSLESEIASYISVRKLSCARLTNNCAINNDCACEAQTVIQGEEHRRRLFENKSAVDNGTCKARYSRLEESQLFA
jgi:hypothetical protein